MEKSNEMSNVHEEPTRSQAISPKEIDPVQWPLVSVIVPTFNRPDTLKTALESVLAQTYPNFEIIVVNDGGEDVKGVIDTLNHQKIVYLRHDANKGLPAARNTGLRRAKGKYISYLDDDDRYSPRHLELLVHCLESCRQKVAYTDSRYVYQTWITDRYVKMKNEVLFSRDFDRQKLLVTNFIPVINLMHRKDLLDEAGYFDEDLDAHEDWDLWIRFAQYSDFHHIKEVTAEVNMRMDGTTMTSGNRLPFLQTMKLIHERYAHLVTDDSILEAQKNSEEFLSVEVAIKQIPSEEPRRQVEGFIKKMDERINNLRTALGDKDTHIGNLDALMKDKDTHIGNLEVLMKDKNVHIGNLEVLMKDKDTHIGNLDALMKDKDAHIGNLEVLMKDKDAHIGNLEVLMKDKDTHIGSLSTAIDAQERIIEKHAGKIQNLESELKVIKNSRIWRIAEYIRSLIYHK